MNPLCTAAHQGAHPRRRQLEGLARTVDDTDAAGGAGHRGNWCVLHDPPPGTEPGGRHWPSTARRRRSHRSTGRPVGATLTADPSRQRQPVTDLNRTSCDSICGCCSNSNVRYRYRNATKSGRMSSTAADGASNGLRGECWEGSCATSEAAIHHRAGPVPIGLLTGLVIPALKNLAWRRSSHPRGSSTGCSSCSACSGRTSICPEAWQGYRGGADRVYPPYANWLATCSRRPGSGP